MKLCSINENTLIKGLRWLEDAAKKLPADVAVYWNNVENEVRIVTSGREEAKRISNLRPIFKVFKDTMVTLGVTHPFGPPWIAVNKK